MYERFTDRSRKVMQLANEEGQRLNHKCIGTEHILLGLVKEGSGVAAGVLKNLDVDLRKIRREVERIVESGPDRVTMGMLPLSPRAKKVIEYAIEEARNLNHNYVGTEHLLLGLLREGEGVGIQVLTNLGLSPEEVRKEVLNLLGHGLEIGRIEDSLADALTKGKLALTPRAKKAIEYALDEARELNHNYVGSEHLLLGLLREQEGVAAQVLMNRGLTLEDVRSEILDVLRGGSQ